MAEHWNQAELDEIDERLGDLWSMNRAERLRRPNYLGRFDWFHCGACLRCMLRHFFIADHAFLPPQAAMIEFASKIVAALIAIGYFAAFVASERGVTANTFKCFVVLLIPLGLIWFSEELGSFTGYAGRGDTIDAATAGPA